MTHAPVSKKRQDGNELEEVKIVPPDGGWGWIVVFASFMIHIVTDGVTYTLGIFYVEFLDYFKSGKAETAWIASILVGVTLCSGPFSSAFVNKYGCRAVTIAGTIIAGVCLILSVFATNVFTLYITIGVGTGFGFGMIYLPAIVSVTMYFEKYRSLATGIAVCGSGFGTTVFAPLTNYLIVNYKWQGALLVIAGIVFFCAVFGAMFKPLTAPEATAQNSSIENGINNNNNVKYQVSDRDFAHDSLLTPNGNQQQIQRSHSIGNDMIKNGTIVLNGNGKAGRTTELIIDEKNRLALSLSQPLLIQSEQKDRQMQLRSGNAGSGTLDRPDVFYQGSLTHIARNRSHASIPMESDRYGSFRKCQDIQPVDEINDKVEVCGCIPCSEDTKDTLTKMMSFGLLKDTIFIIFVISNFLTSIGFNMPYVYLAAQAEVLGISKSDASLLLGVIGFANTIGRIILGYLSDKPWVNRLWVYNVCLTVCGIATVLSAFCYDFWSLAIYAFVFGFTIGAYVGLTSVILVDILGLENLTNAFGLLLLFQGIASFIGPPMGGALYDSMGSYIPGFVLAGIAIALSGVMLFILPTCQRHIAKKEAKTANNLNMVPL
ncbi:unnamed protein product [Diamesa serratosioi]